MIEMMVESIRTSLKGDERVVILKEKASERHLPIWIGPAEAEAMAATMREVAAPRPLTHDLLCSIVGAMGGTIDFVSLNELKGDTFYAGIVISARGRQIELDCRPGDALAVAMRVRVPIYVEETVLDRAGILIDKETGEPITPGKKVHGTNEEQISEDDLRRMSAFRDFVNGLNLDDLDKHKA